MKSRERVKCVLNHKIPDRLPIDVGGSRGTTISGEAYLKLRDFLQGDSERNPYMFDFAQQSVYPEEWFLRMFHVDVIDGGRAFMYDKADCHTWTLNSGREVDVPGYFSYMEENGEFFLYDFLRTTHIARKEAVSLYFTQIYWAFDNIELIPETFEASDLEKNIYALPIHPWDLDLNNQDEFDIFKQNIQKLYETTDYAISLTLGCQIFEMGQYVRGMEKFLCDLYLDESGVRRLLDRLLEKYMRKIEMVIEGVGDYVDILRFVDDLGTQQSLMLNPDKYRELIKPYHKTMWDYIHNHSNCKVALHSCGSISDILPDLIDAGVDVLNPVQISCENMDPVTLKREFGKDIVFWGGGCDTQSILPYHTPEGVAEHVRENIDALAENGGMIFSQIHNIQADVPVENIIAMLKTAYKYGSY